MGRGQEICSRLFFTVEQPDSRRPRKIPGAISMICVMKSIDNWRNKIDGIDSEVVRLLNQRGKCAIEIGKIKEKLDIEIYDARREKEVIQKVQSTNNGPLSKKAVKRLFERIIDESRRAEKEFRSRITACKNTTKKAKKYKE